MSDGISLGNATCIKEHDSGKAIKVDTDEHGILDVPNSQVHDDSEVECYGDEGNLVVKEWWAEEKGLC